MHGGPSSGLHEPAVLQGMHGMMGLEGEGRRWGDKGGVAGFCGLALCVGPTSSRDPPMQLGFTKALGM